MPKDEEQVLAVEALVESWNNPFVGNQNLNSISTAKDAPVDTPYDLLHTCGLSTKIPAIQGGKASKLPSQEEVLRSCEVEKSEDVYVTQQEENTLDSAKNHDTQGRQISFRENDDYGTKSED